MRAYSKTQLLAGPTTGTYICGLPTIAANQDSHPPTNKDTYWCVPIKLPSSPTHSSLGSLLFCSLCPPFFRSFLIQLLQPTEGAYAKMHTEDVTLIVNPNSIDRLPLEMADCVCSYLPEVSDIAHVRLVSKFWNSVATPRLLPKVHLVL